MNRPLKKSRSRARIPLVRATRYYYLRLLRLRGNPGVLARGLAIGVFVGLTPTIPLHTVLIVVLCTVLKGNPLAGILASWIISNPITIPLQYYAAWKIGVLVTGQPISWTDVEDLLALVRSQDILTGIKTLFFYSGRLTGTMLLGGVLFAFPLALLSHHAYLRVYFERAKRRYRRLAAGLEGPKGGTSSHG